MPWPGGVPVVRPPLHRVGAPRAVGGAGGGRLALVLVAGRVRAARPGAHSTKNKVNIFGSFEVPLLQFSVNILRVSPLFNCLFYGYSGPDTAAGCLREIYNFMNAI